MRRVLYLIFAVAALAWLEILVAVRLRDYLDYWHLIALAFVVSCGIFLAIGSRIRARIQRSDFVAADAVVMIVGATALLGISSIDQVFDRNMYEGARNKFEASERLAKTQLTMARQYFCDGRLPPAMVWGNKTTSAICQFVSTVDDATSSASSSENNDMVWKRFLADVQDYINDETKHSMLGLVVDSAEFRSTAVREMSRFKREDNRIATVDKLDFIGRWLLAVALALGVARYLIELSMSNE